MTKRELVKLRAEDVEDLSVIAACLQDAIACIGEMAYEPEAKRFALVVERFRWEETAATPDGPRRGLPATKTGLHFETVKAVKRRGIDIKRRRQVLELLTITSEREAGATAIFLLFAGGGEIRLEVERIACRMMDLEPPHKTKLRPSHPLNEGGKP